MYVNNCLFCLSPQRTIVTCGTSTSPVSTTSPITLRNLDTQDRPRNPVEGSAVEYPRDTGTSCKFKIYVNLV